MFNQPSPHQVLLARCLPDAEHQRWQVTKKNHVQDNNDQCLVALQDQAEYRLALKPCNLTEISLNPVFFPAVYRNGRMTFRQQSHAGCLVSNKAGEIRKALYRQWG